ncbi:hypothetical protein Tco_1227240 [Tanacetum coccineum]
MGSSFASRVASSAAVDPSFVDTLLDQKRREEAKLERLKLARAKKSDEQWLAQKNQELEMQEKMFAFQQEEKFEKDIMYYNEPHDQLSRSQLATTLTLKKKIKKHYNLDY